MHLLDAVKGACCRTAQRFEGRDLGVCEPEVIQHRMRRYDLTDFMIEPL